MSYNDLEALIGNLKQAAIDAWMESHSGGHWKLNELEQKINDGSAYDPWD